MLVGDPQKETVDDEKVHHSSGEWPLALGARSWGARAGETIAVPSSSQIVMGYPNWICTVSPWAEMCLSSLLNSYVSLVWPDPSSHSSRLVVPVSLRF